MALGCSSHRFISTTAAAADLVLQRHASSQTSMHAKGELVILLPGIAGTELTVRGRDASAPSVKGVSNAILTLGEHLGDLRLADSGAHSDDTSDGVLAEQLVADIHLIPSL